MTRPAHLLLVVVALGLAGWRAPDAPAAGADAKVCATMATWKLQLARTNRACGDRWEFGSEGEVSFVREPASESFVVFDNTEKESADFTFEGDVCRLALSVGNARSSDHNFTATLSLEARAGRISGTGVFHSKKSGMAPCRETFRISGSEKREDPRPNAPAAPKK